jgi:hypothetical protein
MPAVLPRSGLLVEFALLGAVISATPLVADDEVRNPSWTAEQRQHWAYQPVRRADVPQVTRPGWDRNPIDAFLLKSMDDVGIEPTPEADRRTLMRRVTLDLTGLPPTPKDVADFLKDDQPDAYERLVNRLLDSPRYGERYARLWLDLARYAESDGFKSDKTRPNAWRYRDWVIDALNRDLPYDQFVRLQLAGDEIAPGDPDAFTATAFNRHWPLEDNNMIPGLNRQLMLDDMTDTTASVFMGLTVACARCHDHKYDPISQADYYRLQALFAAVKPRDDFPIAGAFQVAQQDLVESAHQERRDELQREIDALEGPYREKLLAKKLAALEPEVRVAFDTPPIERSAFQEDLVRIHSNRMKIDPKAMMGALPAADRPAWEAMTKKMEALQKEAPPPLPSTTGMTETGRNAPPVHLLIKGNFKKPGPEIAPGFLSVLCPDPEDIDASEGESSTGRRAALAAWLTRPEHPLTARVMVNRLWLWHFGRGIVATPSDFGNQGQPPTHPELLDWLASEFINQGWSMKAMHRLMITSAAYKQGSIAPAEAIENDPDNVLFSRANRRRLEAEAVRDSLLAVSGQLDPRIGGPSVFPDLPPGIETRGGWTRSAKAEDRNRRSVYVFVRRNLKYPLFDAFDGPDTNVTCPERNVSVNAPQALMLLNSDLVVDIARHFAGRVLTELGDRGDNLEAQVEKSYDLAFGRAPSDVEREKAVAYLKDDVARLSPSVDPKKDLPVPMLEGASPVQAAALVDFCHVLFNLNEFVFAD